MKNFNWVVVLVLLSIVGVVVVFIPNIPLWFVSYLYFTISMTHNQWLSDRRLRIEVD